MKYEFFVLYLRYNCNVMGDLSNLQIIFNVMKFVSTQKITHSSCSEDLMCLFYKLISEQF